ncbi:MAG: S24 family peptidase, partial [Sulfitobacter sp.]
MKLSAGPGANGDNARPFAPVAFRKEWLSQQGLIADRCVVCGVTGDSMEPLLFDADLVLIDRRVTELRDGQVYAVTDVAGDIRIKRLEKIEGGILLRSDNPSSPTEVRMG